MADDPNQTADQVSDLQAQMDQSRSECIRPVIMDHVHRYMRAKSMTDKYHEMESLITFSLNYVEDENIKETVLKDLDMADVNFSNDFVRNYKAEMRSGVPWHIILENEYRTLLPRLRRVWMKVQKALVDQELIPWALTYPEKMLEGALIDEVITDIQMQKFRKSADMRNAEAKITGIPMEPIQTISSYDDFNDDFEEVENEEEEFVGTIPVTLKTEESIVEEESIIDDEEEDEPTIEEPLPLEPGERLFEPELERYKSYDEEPSLPLLPEPEPEDEQQYSDEEIEKGAEAFKKILKEKRDARRD